ncbi:BatD family protein [Dokdonella sp.]|uniref:BatD family protein n=1 Tax=Dokdonella sp. TaxID=2291710 RepID=UPI001B1F429A|nr:BatD family protein [Dokdonella sp.]MBO9664274.1 protein BatD [Dokdonella sp.]
MTLLLATWLLVSMNVWADAPAVRAWLDRDTVQLGETVTLNVEAQAGVGAQPDFSVLKQDFNLLGTQSSQQISIVNGVSQSKTLWAVGLEPKHEGRIAIAPLAVGKAATEPLQLTVLAQQAKAQGKAGDDVFLETNAEPLAPYVQQQVRYTVKLYYAFDLTDGNLSEPQADGVSVQRLGQDKSYIATIGARRYHVVERHYALTPERSGTVEIPPLSFRGNALDAGDPTGFFSRGRAVGARSDAVQLNVKPKAAEWADSAWLPAASLLLKDESELPGEVRVGDPVTRTIRLQAQGLGYEQLPELALSAPAGAEIYPDKTDTRTRDDGEWLYGERVRKFAFVPNRPGTLTIPGLKVRWWNTEQNRAETAELPTHTVNVLPAAGAAATPPAPSTGSAPAASSAAPPATAASPSSALPSRSGSVRPWQALAVLGFALWLVTLALWWRSRRRAAPAMAASPATSADGSSQRAAFLRACSLGEFAGAERALIAWARRERADVRNLGELATRLADAAQREALADLQRTRYAGASAQGLSTRLQTAFKNGLVWADARARRAAEPALPALYPEHP